MPDMRKKPHNRGISYKKVMVNFRPGPFTMRQLIFLSDRRAELDPDTHGTLTDAVVFAIGYAARQLGWSGSKPIEPKQALKSNRDFVDPAKSKRKKKSV